MAETLRIVSANLWNGRADADAFAAQVETLGADVVAVQELGPEQADALAAILPHGALQPSLQHRGMGLAARHPGTLSHIPMPLRDGWILRLEPSHWPRLARPVEVVNLHFCAPHVVFTTFGLWMRRRQLRDFERFHGREPAPRAAPLPRVLVGDFNATPRWPLYRSVARRYEDAAVAAAARHATRPAPTWGPWSGAPRLLRIDHAFVRGLAVESLRVVPVRGSDHSALVVDLIVS